MYLETLHTALPRVGSVVVMKDGQVLPLLNLGDGELRRVTQGEAAQ
jgi:hypothetical protein